MNGGLARGLRRRQTDSERILWRQLRDRQLHDAKFRRQHPIGPYIVDFCCPAHRLVIELDGGHHAAQIRADERRTAFLRQRGYQVLRFWDHEVLGNREAVLRAIEEALSHPHPTPLPPRGRGKQPAAIGIPESPQSLCASQTDRSRASQLPLLPRERAEEYMARGNSKEP